MTEIAMVLQDFVGNPYLQTLTWLLSSTGALDRMLEAFADSPSDAQTQSEAVTETRAVTGREEFGQADTIAPLGFPTISLTRTDVAERFLREGFLRYELPIWKGFHGIHPYMADYACIIHDVLDELRVDDVQQWADRIAERFEHLSDSYKQRCPTFDDCLERLASTSFRPLLARFVAQAERSGQASMASEFGVLVEPPEVIDPVRWFKLVERVARATLEVRPLPEALTGAQPATERYLQLRRDALRHGMFFTGRLLLAREVLNVVSRRPAVKTEYQMQRVAFRSVIANGLSADASKVLVEKANDVIFAALDLVYPASNSGPAELGVAS